MQTVTSPCCLCTCWTLLDISCNDVGTTYLYSGQARTKDVNSFYGPISIQPEQQLLKESQVPNQLSSQTLLLLLQAGVKTLSVRLGPKRVFWVCVALLEVAYAGAICLGALSQVSFSAKACHIA